MKEEPNIHSEIILIDNEYFISLINDIQLAKETIDMESYIFSEDKIGKDVLHALLAAAKRGVRVRLLVDGFGTLNWKSLKVKIDSDNMVLKPYHPLFISLFQWPFHRESVKYLHHYLTHINLRNHRKTCLIDKKILYAGSANISECTYIRNEKRYWHDITVKLTNISFQEIEFAFDKAWECFSLKERVHQLFNTIDQDPHIRLNYTLIKRYKLYKDLIKRLNNSKRRIYISNAYFIPSRFFLRKLRAAAKRNVEIIIIVPGQPDVLGASLITRSLYYALLQSGISIYHYNSGVLHTKLIIVDDWFCVGSSNLNHRSLHNDLEIDVNIRNIDAKKVLEEQLKIYLQAAKKVDINELKSQSFLEKIAIHFLMIFRFLF